MTTPTDRLCCGQPMLPLRSINYHPGDFTDDRYTWARRPFHCATCHKVQKFVPTRKEWEQFSVVDPEDPAPAFLRTYGYSIYDTFEV